MRPEIIETPESAVKDMVERLWEIGDTLDLDITIAEIAAEVEAMAVVESVVERG